MIIEYHKIEATHLPKEDFARMVAELLDAGGNIAHELTEEVVELLASDGKRAAEGSVREATDHAVAKLDVQQALMHAALERRALESWLRAIDELIALDKPAGTLGERSNTSH